MDVAELARKMVAAAEKGETEWLSYDSLYSRFAEEENFPEDLNSLPIEISRLGWDLVPVVIKNWEMRPNSISGNPAGFRLERD